jgi:hypothetical protein
VVEGEEEKEWEGKGGKEGVGIRRRERGKVDLVATTCHVDIRSNSSM